MGPVRARHPLPEPLPLISTQRQAQVPASGRNPRPAPSLPVDAPTGHRALLDLPPSPPPRHAPSGHARPPSRQRAVPVAARARAATADVPRRRELRRRVSHGLADVQLAGVGAARRRAICRERSRFRQMTRSTAPTWQNPQIIHICARPGAAPTTGRPSITAVHAHALVAVRHRRVLAGIRQSRIAQPEAAAAGRSGFGRCVHYRTARKCS